MSVLLCQLHDVSVGMGPLCDVIKAYMAQSIANGAQVPHSSSTHARSGHYHFMHKKA